MLTDKFKVESFSLINSFEAESPSNIILVNNDKNNKIRSIINKKSYEADLTIVGYKSELIKKQKQELFNGYENLGNIMFVNSLSEKEIINTKE